MMGGVSRSRDWTEDLSSEEIALERAPTYIIIHNTNSDWLRSLGFDQEKVI